MNTSTDSTREDRSASADFPMDRRLARLVAVQLLYQVEIRKTSASVVLEEFRWGHMSETIDGICYTGVKFGLLAAIVEGACARQPKLDRQIDAVFDPKISPRRVEILLRLILRAGTYELLAHRDLSLRVIVNEYIEITQAFFDQHEPALVNAVLDRIAHLLRQ